MVLFVAFTASVFALSSVAQRRGRGHGRGHAGSTASGVPPHSNQIAQELGGIQWGATHDQVVEYFARTITARYQPLLRNKGQVEQDRLIQDRDHEIAQVRGSYVTFNGAANQRRWDTSFIGSEYTHNNGETMLMREDPQSGSREFFFFFNDRLWKRFQARNIPASPSGQRIEFATFASSLEQLFGRGLHRMAEGSADQLASVEWQDDQTRLRVVDNSTFYNSFGLIYEERATLNRLADLRRNAPTKTTTSTTARLNPAEPVVGNVEGDPNADIVDRITGKMRRVQDGPAGGSGARPGATPAAGSSTPAPAPPSSSGGSNANDDPLRGL
jgi:hypothetical protein